MDYFQPTAPQPLPTLKPYAARLFFEINQVYLVLSSYRYTFKDPPSLLPKNSLFLGVRNFFAFFSSQFIRSDFLFHCQVEQEIDSTFRK